MTKNHEDSSVKKFDVLVVDDDPDKRMLLTIALEIAGYEVRNANDGEAGLAAVESYQPDLIVTDVMMPKMDGYELARRVRANPLTRFIPIIIQTAARSEAQDARRGAEVGALGYITDPLDIDLLLARVRTLLDFKGYLNMLEETLRNIRASATPAPQYTTPPEAVEQTEEQTQQNEVIRIIKRKVENHEFDVFLCHNSEDKPMVKEIGKLLRQQGILPWLDEWNLRPGLPWQDALEQEIPNIKCAAVFVGKNGIGPWQKAELSAFLREFINRGCPVIPTLLSDAPSTPELPVFLKAMTWVDFRTADPDPMERLVWGITGQSPSD